MVDDDNNGELTPQPKPFPPELLVGYENEAVAHAVRDCLWGKGPIDYGVVSGNMNGDLVSRFVAFELENLPPQNYWRVRILADLYNLVELLELFESFLNGKEDTPEELNRSIACTTILKEIGGPEHQERAVKYYEYLVAHRFAIANFEELIRCLAALGPSVTPDSLRARMEKQVSAYAMVEQSDPEAGVEKRWIEDLLNNEFFFIDEANTARQRISAIADPDVRLLEEIRAYFELTDDGGAQYIDLWIQQQIRRTADNFGREKVIEFLRRASRSPEAETPFVKVRCANAIEFFLGKLVPEEAEFMVKNRKIQIDPLRFMPLPPHMEDPFAVEDLDEDDDEDELSGEEV